MGAVFFTLLLLTGNTMAQAVRERIPELATLKTMGFSDKTVLLLVFGEAILLVVIGGVLGMAGNVSEWVGDWAPSMKNPILKGGSYLSPDVRLDRRVDNLKFEAISESIGFRTVNQSLAPK